MFCLSSSIWPEGGLMSVSITPQGRKKINTRRLAGDRQRLWAEELQSKWRKWKCWELEDKLYALWCPEGRQKILQMKVTWSYIKDALPTCPINGIVSQEKRGPLEYAMKLSGSLKHHSTALDAKPTRATGSCRICGEMVAAYYVI